MSLRQRLLSLTSSLLDAGQTDLKEFASSFADLEGEISAAQRAGSLCKEDQELTLRLAKGIEAIASAFLGLDHAKERHLRDLESAISLKLNESVPLETIAPPQPLPKLGVKSNIENPASFRHLRDWFLANIHYPFPTPEEKQELAEAKDLKLKSVNLWFTNIRRRSNWSTVEKEHASGNHDIMKTLVARFQAEDPTLDPLFVEQLQLVINYVDEKSSEKPREWMVDVIKSVIEDVDNNPSFVGSDEDEDEEELESEEDKDEVEQELQPPSPSVVKKRASAPIDTTNELKRIKVVPAPSSKPKRQVSLTINTARAAAANMIPRPLLNHKPLSVLSPGSSSSSPSSACEDKNDGDFQPSTRRCPAQSRPQAQPQQICQPTPQRLAPLPFTSSSTREPLSSSSQLHSSPHNIDSTPSGPVAHPSGTIAFPSSPASHQPYYTEEVHVRRTYSPSHTAHYSQPSPRRGLAYPSHSSAVHQSQHRPHPSRSSQRYAPYEKPIYYYPSQGPPPGSHVSPPHPRLTRPRHVTNPPPPSSAVPHPHAYPRSLSASYAHVSSDPQNAQPPPYSYAPHPSHQYQSLPRSHYQDQPSHTRPRVSQPLPPPGFSQTGATPQTQHLRPEPQCLASFSSPSSNPSPNTSAAGPADPVAAFHARQERLRLEREALRREAEALGLPYQE